MLEVELADDVLAFAKRGPWSLRPGAHPAREHLWKYWNIAAVAAGYRLLRSIVLLASKGQVWEGWCLLRSLLELVGNQQFILQDQDRVFEFIRRGSKRQQKTVETARKTGYVAEEDWKALAAEASAEITKLKPFDIEGLAFSDEPHDVLPAIGLEEHYDMVYQPIGNFVHVNAMAFEFYAEEDDDGSMVPAWGPDETGAEGLLRYSIQYYVGLLETALESFTPLDAEAQEIEEFWTRLSKLRSTST
jgi:hypothetical protein